MILFAFGLALGILLGRVYGKMKYRYPEFQEMILLKQAKLRAERAKYEAATERFRAEIDDLLSERMK